MSNIIANFLHLPFSMCGSDLKRELTIREELKCLAEQGDLTSAMIRGLQFKAEEEYQATPSRPIRLGRRSSGQR